MKNRSILFTFITEKEGGTYIEQFPGASLEEATLRWYKESETRPGELLEDRWPVPIDGRKNVWCISGMDDQDVFFLANIVATSDD